MFRFFAYTMSAKRTNFPFQEVTSFWVKKYSSRHYDVAIIVSDHEHEQRSLLSHG